MNSDLSGVKKSIEALQFVNAAKLLKIQLVLIRFYQFHLKYQVLELF